MAAGVECSPSVPSPYRGLNQDGMGLPHSCFPFRDRSIVGLEAVEVRLGKQLKKSSGVISVIGAYFQDNRIAPADHG